MFLQNMRGDFHIKNECTKQEEEEKNAQEEDKEEES